MLEVLKIFGISYVIAWGVYLVFLIVLKLSKKSIQDVKKWLANFFNIKFADFIVEFFTFLLAIVLYFPVKNYLYTPTSSQVKEMVLKLYENNPSFLNDILKRKHKKLSDAVNNIKVLYIKKLDSNSFKAYVSYNFLDLKCNAVLHINTIEWGKYFFGFDNVKCYPNF